MIIWTIITFVFIITPSLSETFFKTILVIPMVLFIPGYVLITALFPKKDDLDVVERLALSSGLSITITPVLGMLLKFALGAELVHVLIALCILTIILIRFFRSSDISSFEVFFSFSSHTFHLFGIVE